MTKQNFNRELVKKAIKAKGLNYKDLADEMLKEGISISESAIKIWFRTTNPSSPELEKIKVLSRILDLPLNDILGFENTENSRILTAQKIPLLEMSAGFGTEGILDADFRIRSYITIDTRLLGRVDMAHARIIECFGDSMSPEFENGDFILVEMLDNRDFIKRPGLYLVRIDNIVYIKRVEFLPDNDIRLISINPAYPTFTASSTGHCAEIIGCVYGRISVKISNGFLFSNQGVK